MACSSSSSSSSHRVRSATATASHPEKKNPVIAKIEKHLEKLRESEASSTSPLQTISIGLNGLTNLYKCVDDAVNYLPPLPHHNTYTHIEQLVNRSKRLLEVCTSSREVLGRLREAVGEIKLSDEKLLGVPSYFSARKEIVKRAKALSLRVRQVEEEFMSEKRELIQEELELTRVFRCVSIINISVMESLLQLLSSKPRRSSRFSLLWKLWIGRSKIANELAGGKGNELSNVDVALHAVFFKKGGERMMIAQKRLQGLEAGLIGIEDSLSCISSQLTKTKASLLNIVTFYNLISSVF